MQNTTTSMKRSEALRKGQGYEGKTAERSPNTTQNTATPHTNGDYLFKGREEGFKDKVDHPDD